MGDMKQIFYTLVGSEKAEMKEIPADCCIADLIEALTKDHGIEDKAGIKIHRGSADLDDKDTALPDNMPIKGLPDKKPVHFGKCPEISVNIYYLSKTQSLKVSPGMLVGPLLDQALRYFKPEDVRDKGYVLKVRGTDQEPGRGVFVASLAKPGDCSVEFNLAPAERWQG